MHEQDWARGCGGRRRASAAQSATIEQHSSGPTPHPELRLAGGAASSARWWPALQTCRALPGRFFLGLSGSVQRAAARATGWVLTPQQTRRCLLSSLLTPPFLFYPNPQRRSGLRRSSRRARCALSCTRRHRWVESGGGGGGSEAAFSTPLPVLARRRALQCHIAS